MNKMDGILIMRPFNGVFFGVFALFILVLILVSLWLKKKDIETRKYFKSSKFAFKSFSTK